MEEAARLVGMEVRDFTGQDGRQRQYCGLHLVHVEDSVRRVKGCKVEVMSCPQEIDPRKLKLGMMYQTEYET